MSPFTFPFTKATAIAATLATCFAPSFCFGQGDFAPNEQVSRVIELKPRDQKLINSPLSALQVPKFDMDNTQPPKPLGGSTNRRSMSPAEVDYEVIDSNGNGGYSNNSGPVVSDASEFAKFAPTKEIATKKTKGGS